MISQKTEARFLSGVVSGLLHTLPLYPHCVLDSVLCLLENSDLFFYHLVFHPHGFWFVLVAALDSRSDPLAAPIRRLPHVLGVTADRSHGSQAPTSSASAAVRLRGRALHRRALASKKSSPITQPPSPSYPQSEPRPESAHPGNPASWPHPLGHRSARISLGYISTPLIWQGRKRPVRGRPAPTRAPAGPTVHITKPAAVRPTSTMREQPLTLPYITYTPARLASPPSPNQVTESEPPQWYQSTEAPESSLLVEAALPTSPPSSSPSVLSNRKSKPLALLLGGSSRDQPTAAENWTDPPEPEPLADEFPSGSEPLGLDLTGLSFYEFYADPDQRATILKLQPPVDTSDPADARTAHGQTPDTGRDLPPRGSPASDPQTRHMFPNRTVSVPTPFVLVPAASAISGLQQTFSESLPSFLLPSSNSFPPLSLPPRPPPSPLPPPPFLPSSLRAEPGLEDGGGLFESADVLNPDGAGVKVGDRDSVVMGVDTLPLPVSSEAPTESSHVDGTLFLAEEFSKQTAEPLENTGLLHTPSGLFFLSHQTLSDPFSQIGTTPSGLSPVLHPDFTPQTEPAPIQMALLDPESSLLGVLWPSFPVAALLYFDQRHEDVKSPRLIHPSVDTTSAAGTPGRERSPTLQRENMERLKPESSTLPSVISSPDPLSCYPSQTSVTVSVDTVSTAMKEQMVGEESATSLSVSANPVEKISPLSAQTRDRNTEQLSLNTDQSGLTGSHRSSVVPQEALTGSGHLLSDPSAVAATWTRRLLQRDAATQANAAFTPPLPSPPILSSSTLSPPPPCLLTPPIVSSLPHSSPSRSPLSSQSAVSAGVAKAESGSLLPSWPAVGFQQPTRCQSDTAAPPEDSTHSWSDPQTLAESRFTPSGPPLPAGDTDCGELLPTKSSQTADSESSSEEKRVLAAFDPANVIPKIHAVAEPDSPPAVGDAPVLFPVEMTSSLPCLTSQSRPAATERPAVAPVLLDPPLYSGPNTASVTPPPSGPPADYTPVLSFSSGSDESASPHSKTGSTELLPVNALKPNRTNAGSGRGDNAMGAGISAAGTPDGLNSGTPAHPSSVSPDLHPLTPTKITSPLTAPISMLAPPRPASGPPLAEAAAPCQCKHGRQYTCVCGRSSANSMSLCSTVDREPTLRVCLIF